MTQKSSKKTKIFALILMCLLLASCGNQKPLSMKSGEDINRILSDNFYQINTKDMKYYPAKDLIDSAESGVYPSVTVLNGNSTSSVIFQYAGLYEIGSKKIIVKTDSHKYNLKFDSSQIDSNESMLTSNVTERVLFNVDRKKYDMLKDMANSNNTSVMFNGDDQYSFELTRDNKKLLQSFLSCFEED